MKYFETYITFALAAVVIALVLGAVRLFVFDFSWWYIAGPMLFASPAVTIMVLLFFSVWSKD